MGVWNKLCDLSGLLVGIATLLLMVALVWVIYLLEWVAAWRQAKSYLGGER